MSAETRGQNSYVNYTPVNAELLAKKHEVEERIARAKRSGDEDAVKEGHAARSDIMGGWQYAPQTSVLLPPEMIQPEYDGAMPDYIQPLIRPDEGTGMSSPLTHFSHEPDLQELDPTRYGTGIKGDERFRVTRRPGAVQQRAYGYLGTPGQVKPESGLGRHAYTAQGENLYDLSTDPAKLMMLARESNRTSPLGNFNPGMVENDQAMNDAERMAKEYGYSGVANPKAMFPMAAVFNKTPVQPAQQDDIVQKALKITGPK
jgi:hypothetical protein